MVFLIVGKTCSGKDTVAHYLEEKYGFKRVVTYTTRPMRPDDVQDVSHHFVSCVDLSKYDDVFSPTEIDSYWYFMRRSQFEGADCVVIVDPQGVKDFREAGIPCKAIYVDCPEDLILKRAAERETDYGVVSSRLNAERARFDEFRRAEMYDWLVSNESTVDVLKALVDTAMITLCGCVEDCSGSPQIL